MWTQCQGQSRSSSPRQHLSACAATDTTPEASLSCTAAAATASETAGGSVSACAASGCKHGEVNTTAAANRAPVAGSAKAALLLCSPSAAPTALTGAPRAYDLRGSRKGRARPGLQRQGRLEQGPIKFALAAAVQRSLHAIMSICLCACHEERRRHRHEASDKPPRHSTGCWTRTF